ncbi:MAG: V-type ATP synthase subunit E [Eubacteriales bacterium]|nr:V-type ATP synthase subunit E [Eubacteriales bacterium]
MTIEEKLQHFFDVSVEDARLKTEGELEEHRKKMEEMLAQHKKSKQQEAEAQVKAEAENARREVNKILSAQQLSLKRDWSRKQKDLTDKLFVEVKDHLAHFMDTPEYEEYLCKRIKEAVAFAGEDEIFLYITPEDSSLQRALVARTGCPVQIAQEAFMGGLKATIPSKNILIDNSFAGGFHALKKEFKFKGGPDHA